MAKTKEGVPQGDVFDQAIAVRESGALASPVPMESLGFDDFSMEDLVVPRLRLLQGMSQAVVDGKGQLGQFQDSLTEEVLGDKVELVLMSFKNGAVYFHDGKLKCKSVDGITNVQGDACKLCPHSVYHKGEWTDGKSPACSSTKEFIAVTKATVEGKEMKPYIVTFTKTSYKTGTKLISMARLAAPQIFACGYEFQGVKEKNSKGTFGNFSIKPTGKLPPEQFSKAYEVYQLLKGTNLKAHDTLEEQPVEDVQY